MNIEDGLEGPQAKRDRDNLVWLGRGVIRTKIRIIRFSGPVFFSVVFQIFLVKSTQSCLDPTLGEMIFSNGGEI